MSVAKKAGLTFTVTGAMVASALVWSGKTDAKVEDHGRRLDKLEVMAEDVNYIRKFIERLDKNSGNKAR